MSKKTLNFIGKLLMLLSLIFIGVKLWNYKIDFTMYLSGLNIVIFTIMILLTGGVGLLYALNFRRILSNITNKKTPYVKVVYHYCRSNLYKYLPGNVMHYIGRNQLAVEENLLHADVALSSLLEIISLLFASMIISVGFSLDYVIKWLKSSQKMDISFIVLIILIGIALIGIIIFRKKIKAYIIKHKSIFSINGIKDFLFVVIYQAICLLIRGLIFTTVFQAVCGIVPLNIFITILGLFSLSWVIGFITPGVPGGIGVREAMMLMFLTGLASEEKILTSAIIYRIISVLGDLCSYGYAVGLKHFYRKN